MPSWLRNHSFLLRNFTAFNVCFSEVFCPDNLPSVAEYEYPGIGQVPDHFSGAKKRARRSTALNGSGIASPVNPYVGMKCAEYTYDLWQGEFIATGNIACILPEQLLARVTDLAVISTYKNYFICNGVNDCHEGEDEATDLCGQFSLSLFQSKLK